MAEEKPATGLKPLTAAQGALLLEAADALSLVIRLHDREADAALLDGLRESDAPGLFAGIMPTEEGRHAASALQQALDALPDPVDAQTLDALASDYADIYLTHAHRLSPNGSVWMTIESLERQLPMFEVREFYTHWGITVPNWRIRSDDNIVHELQFVEFLLREGTAEAAFDAAKFLDRHVLPWVPPFCAGMAHRANEMFYAASGMVTAAFLMVLRNRITEITGVVPEIAPLPEEPVVPPKEEAPFVPGAAPSW